jgi:hypothetical protein
MTTYPIFNLGYSTQAVKYCSAVVSAKDASTAKNLLEQAVRNEPHGTKLEACVDSIIRSEVSANKEAVIYFSHPTLVEPVKRT